MLLSECYFFAYLLSSKCFVLMQFIVNVLSGNFVSYEYKFAKFKK